MFLILLILIGYLGVTIYLANQVELARKSNDAHKNPSETPERTVQALLYMGVSLIALLGFSVFSIAATSDRMAELAEQGEDVLVLDVDPLLTIIVAALTFALAVAAFIAIRSLPARQKLQTWIGKHGQFRATSLVHTTAIVLSLLIIAAQIASFVLQGGTEGMAESIETDGVDTTLPVFQAFIQVMAAFLGVGWIIRRSVPAALARLGLRWPTPDDMRHGLLTAGGLLAMIFVYGIVLSVLINSGLIDQADIDEQNRAAEGMAQAFATVPLAFVLSASAAIGEEILFRGALQPIFGNLLVSIFFALMHTQNLLSPGILLIFAVSLVLGWLRERHSTTAAIIAHFTYNFVQLLLLVLASSAEAV